VFLATCFKYRCRGLPTAFFPDIAISRTFTTNSLRLTVCPIHEWRLFFFNLKVIFLLSPFEKLHHSLLHFSILFLTFFSSSMFQMHLRSFLVIGTAIVQKPTGEDGSHRIGCHTAMWKGRRNRSIMISKQQRKYCDKSTWY